MAFIKYKYLDIIFYPLFSFSIVHSLVLRKKNQTYTHILKEHDMQDLGFFFSFEVWLIYNVLVSTVQQTDSVIHIET